MSVRVFAPAKVNLCLHVGRPREDGLHPLWSLAAFADVGDWVRASPADALTLALSGPFAEALEGDADNLVLRAARLLAQRAGVRPLASLHLVKQLPIASGLGGGSADAAATLKALNALWRLDLADADLHALATELGADVAACLRSRACVMTGAGERIAALELPALWGVLANPGIASATASVYRAFDAAGLGGAFAAGAAPRWDSAAAAIAGLKALRNDLEAPACGLAPQIAAAAATLSAYEEAELVRLSGSGATLLALTAEADAAQRLSLRLRRDYPQWWTTRVALG